MPDRKTGGRLLQAAAALLLLLELSAEVLEPRDGELETEQTDSRSNRAKRRGGSDALRG